LDPTIKSSTLHAFLGKYNNTSCCYVVQLVAIGKTTAEAMRSKGWKVTAVADQPKPQALAQCIVESTKDKE